MLEISFAAGTTKASVVKFVAMEKTPKGSAAPPVSERCSWCSLCDGRRRPSAATTAATASSTPPTTRSSDASSRGSVGSEIAWPNSTMAPTMTSSVPSTPAA